MAFPSIVQESINSPEWGICNTVQSYAKLR
jgi:hypothetical protein